MVSIDYRLYDVVEEQLIFDMFKSLGYIHIRKKKKAIRKGDNWISADEFWKIEEDGRYHIFIEFSRKSSGYIAYPQVDIHAHYDYFRKKGEKDIHVTRRNIKRDLNEMYEIHDAFKEYGFGYMEYKSQNSAHGTIKNTYMKLLIAELKQEYRYEMDGKYKKKLPDGQITIQLIEQRRYSHIVCVYAIGEKHDLHRDKAIDELKGIMDKVYEKIKNTEVKYGELKGRLKKEVQKLNELKERRDSKNARTQGLISKLKDVEQKIKDCAIPKKKKALVYTRKKLERKLITNKKMADKYHDNYCALKKEVQKLKKQVKKYKV